MFVYMSETKTEYIFPDHQGDVSPEDLSKFMVAHPELFPGILGETATRLVGGEQNLTAVEPDTEGAEIEKLNREVVQDSDGWSRLLLGTPAEGISVVFKGRHDLPEMQIIGSTHEGVSVRPLYHDEPRGLSGVLKSEQQIAYSGSHGGDPRLLARRDGARVIVDRALERSEGRKDVVLICDETPQGFRALFQALRGLVKDEDLSETALRLSQTEYEGLTEPNAEVMGLFSEIATELTAALTDGAHTPHEALELVFLAHVGTPEIRKASTDKLSMIIGERLKKDYFGEDEPEVHEARKQELIEAVEDPERSDFYVHRDKGLLRPGQLILTGGSYYDHPRYTTHGCLNVAIDVERNIYGSGGHGVAKESGSTTVASPMGEFVKINGMPVNYEASDTYFINHIGLVIPEGSLFVTVSPDAPPEDLSNSEIWMPLLMTDEDIENGMLKEVISRIGNSIYGSVLSDDDRSNLTWTIEGLIKEVDRSWEVQSLATTLIVQSETEYIMSTKGLTEDQARDEYHRRIRETRLGYEFTELVEVDGIKLKDFSFSEHAKKIAVETALDRLMSGFEVSMSGAGFSVSESGDIVIPVDLREELIGPEGIENIIIAVRGSAAFKKLSQQKQEEFLEKINEFYGKLPTNNLLIEKHSNGYGYSHEWGYEVNRRAINILQLKCDELSTSISMAEELDKSVVRYSSGRPTIYTLYEQAKESNLANTLKAEGKNLDIYAATLAIHTGGSDEEVRSKYEELLAQAHKEASGLVRAERLRDWITYNIINQDEFKSIYTTILESNLAKARSQRRTDYLQVWLTNTFISKARGKPVPKLESFGRGLDWDVPGATDQINRDYGLAESVGVETERHADSYQSNNEGRIYSAISELKSAILANPKGADYNDFIKAIKDLPLGIATRYVRAGIISFDQVEKKFDEVGDGGRGLW